MSKKRGLVFANDEYYHVYNRGVDRRVTFTNQREYERALQLLWFYQYTAIPIRYSRYNEVEGQLKIKYLEQMKASGKLIEIVAYSLMPNHFHLLIKQKQEQGLPKYVANFVNAYTKYFNTKYQRTGALFQGIFKAVYVESEEQLVHLTRYIHLNPVASRLITINDLATYPWSSHQYYLSNTSSDIIEHDTISMIRTLVPDYENFVDDQVSYAQELEKIKHMTFEHD
jgi:putative transposase